MPARRAPTDRTAGEPDPEPADQGNVDPEVPEDPVVPEVQWKGPPDNDPQDRY